MPVINFDYHDLCSLIGQEIPRDKLLERIAMIGADTGDTLPDSDEMSVEFFPNRPDMYCVEGVARSMRAFLDIEPGMMEYDVQDSDIDVYVDPSVKDVRPCFRCATVMGVDIDDKVLKALMQTQEKLHITIGRKRSKVAIGVHDLDKIVPPFTYKAVAPHSVKFVPLAKTEEWDLDEILQKHEKGMAYANLLKGMPRYPIITDRNGSVLSFPPIINGALTTVTTKTRNLFIDVTGTDMKAVKGALDIMVTAMAERGGQIFSVKMHEDGQEFRSPDLSSTSWQFSRKACEKFLGAKIGAKGTEKALRRMGLDCLSEGDIVHVEVPSTRLDIMHIVDIYEDVAVGYGFEKFGQGKPVTQTAGRLASVTSFSENVRDLMVGLGFTEAMTLTLSSEREEFEDSGLPVKDVVTVLNPITEDHTCLRSSLFPSLMRILRRNKHRDLPQKIFEVGDVVTDIKKERRLAAVVMDSRSSFTDIKSITEAVMREIAPGKYSFRASEYRTFIPGRGAEIVVDGKLVGWFGEVSPQVVTDFDVTHPVMMMEIIVQPFADSMAGSLF